MNPDKWFDYLEGKLPDGERTQLEERLISDPQLQRELTVARRIHASTHGESREAMVDDPAQAARGRRMALRVGTAFVVLMAVNVAAGLWIIARREASNPNRKLLENQMREQLMKSLERAAHANLSPPALDMSEITIPAARGQMNRMADQVVSLAQKVGGTGTKELPDPNQIGVLVDLPADREPEFRATIAGMTGANVPSPSPVNASPGRADKKSIVVHIVEPQSP